MIQFEVSGLEESNNNALKHYEIEFSQPVNATWLQNVIKAALEGEEERLNPHIVQCPDCGKRFNSRGQHWCMNKTSLD